MVLDYDLIYWGYSMATLDARSLQVLQQLIDCYIADGLPVGSKTLAESSALALSSSSIRKIMNELEAAGFLESPHTSAGRIPTIQGYRLFVDNLLMTDAVTITSAMNTLKKQLSAERDTTRLFDQASNFLSNITKLTGVITLPKHEKNTLKLVEFVPLAERRVLVILVINENEVQNRIIETARSYHRRELELAGTYLTRHFAGLDLKEVCARLTEVTKTAQKNLQEMLNNVTLIVSQAISPADAECVIAGERNLYDFAADYQHLRNLMETFSNKQRVLHLLKRCLQAEGIQIFIGDEVGDEIAEELSIVAAPYTNKGKLVGVLGVIGPTRMPYRDVIHAVNITAKMLSESLPT